MNKYLLIAVIGIQSIPMLSAMKIDYGTIANEVQAAYPVIKQEADNIRGAVSNVINKLQTSGVTKEQINNIVNTFKSIANAINSNEPDINQIKTLTDQARNQLRTIVGQLDLTGYLGNAQQIFTNTRSLVDKLLTTYNVVSNVLKVLPDNAVAGLNGIKGNIEGLISNVTTVANALKADPNFQQIIQTAQKAITQPA